MVKKLAKAKEQHGCQFGAFLLMFYKSYPSDLLVVLNDVAEQKHS